MTITGKELEAWPRRKAVALLALLLFQQPGLCSLAANPPEQSSAISEQVPLTTSPQIRMLHTDSLSWAPQRDAIRSAWLDALGPFPEQVPLEPRVLSTVRETDHDRLLVTYQTEPGIRTDAFLLIPRNRKERAPAVVVFHATTGDHILQPVGLASAPTRHLALHLVRRGYVTLSPRCFIYGDADEQATTAPQAVSGKTSTYTSETKALLRRNSGWTGMGRMLLDGMRAVDYLQTRPEVAPDRIGSVGHSLGAKESLYLAAFDPRVRAAVFSEGGVGFRHTNWNSVWYLGNRIPEKGSAHDHHELLALTAPRPFLLVGGGEADGEHTRPLVEAARPVYALHGAPDALVLLLHDKGHDFPAEVREQAFDWLDEQLKNE